MALFSWTLDRLVLKVSTTPVSPSSECAAKPKMQKGNTILYRLIHEGLVPGLIRVDFRQFQSSIFASPLARAPFSIASLSERLV